MRPRSGFTLVELLLFTGIIAVMAGALVGFSLVSTNLSTRSEVTAEVEENAAVVSQRIIREVQNADIVARPASGASAGYLILVQLDSNRRPQREVMIELFRDRVRIIEDQSNVAFLTTEDMGVSDLTFLHFGTAGAGEGVSFIFRAYNKAAGAGVSAKQYVRDFRGTAVIRAAFCDVTMAPCTGGDTCCPNGVCATDCGGCETSADCPAAPSCALATCDYNVPRCNTATGFCENVAMGPCASCSRCGDGVKDEAAGEECDDVCADGVGLPAGCTDNLPPNNDDACTNECKAALCGDRVIRSG